MVVLLLLKLVQCKIHFISTIPGLVPIKMLKFDNLLKFLNLQGGGWRILHIFEYPFYDFYNSIQYLLQINGSLSYPYII
jgi:hypothetical protein